MISVRWSLSRGGAAAVVATPSPLPPPLPPEHERGSPENSPVYTTLHYVTFGGPCSYLVHGPNSNKETTLFALLALFSTFW